MKYSKYLNLLLNHIKKSSKEIKLVYLALIFFLVILIGILTSPSTDQNEYELGIEAFKNQNWEEAIYHFKNIENRNDFIGVEDKITLIHNIQDSIRTFEINKMYSEKVDKAKVLLNQNKYGELVMLLNKFPSEHILSHEASILLSQAKKYYDEEIISVEAGKKFICKICQTELNKETKFINVKRKESDKYKITSITKCRCENCLAKLQDEFENIRYDYYDEYSEQINQIKKSEVYRKANNATKNFASEIDFVARNWEGIIEKIETPYMGSSNVNLSIISKKNGINISYHENWLVGNIKKGTKVYNQLLELEEGNRVKFDFKFRRDWDGDISETSLYEEASLKEPSFTVQFLNISR